MFIANDPWKNHSKPQRGGTPTPQQRHAAPPELAVDVSGSFELSSLYESFSHAGVSLSTFEFVPILLLGIPGVCMKKLAFVFGIVMVAAVLVAAGYWLGFGHRSMAEAYSVTALDKALTDASWHARILHYLDSGNVEAARSLLRSRMDSDIITIWAFGDYSDSRSRKMATNVLAGIDAFRTEYPSNYTARTSGSEADIDAKIATILEQAKKAMTK